MGAVKSDRATVGRAIGRAAGTLVGSIVDVGSKSSSIVSAASVASAGMSG